MGYDGTQWDETNPTNETLVNEGDDCMRDIKIGVRSRMAQEHVWPDTQSATSQGGPHKYVTFQAQTGAPTLVIGTNTQVGAIFVTSGALTFENSAGVSIPIVASGKSELALLAGTGAMGTIPCVTSGGGLTPIIAASSGYVLTAQGSTATPAFVLPPRIVGTFGATAHGATIALPSGANADEVTGLMVAMGDCSSAYATSNPDGIYTVCTVNASRVVTCTWKSINVSGGSGVGTANYIILAAITH